MSSRSQPGQPMKVVHIKTQYVEADAYSFKSVVQSLTGKDSTIAEAPSSSWIMKVSKEKNSSTARPQSRLARMSHNSEASKGQHLLDSRDENNFQDHMGRGDVGGGGSGGTYSFLSRNLSYKEMDRLLKELTPLDELHKFLSFD